MPSLLADFHVAVQRHPQRIAIIDGKGRQTTYVQLKARADCLARAWHAKGIRPGDRVLLAMALDADLYASLAALWSLGAVVVLPEPAMGVAGLRHAAKVTNVTAFCSSGLYGVLKYALPALWSLHQLRPHGEGLDVNLPAPSPHDIALISFTSGTTGAPKAIPRSHAFLTAQHYAIAPMLDSPTDQCDLVAFPVFVLINIASGRTSVLPAWKMSRLAQLDPARLASWITAQGVTRALLPPSLCEKLAVAPMPPSLQTVFTGGGPVFPDLVKDLTKAQLDVVCVYGSTEAEPIAHLSAQQIAPEDFARMTGGRGLLVGHPVAGLQLRIVKDEIQVAGDHVNSGYLDPSHDADNKLYDAGTIWHRTGDAGYLDASGRLWLLGRLGSQVCTNRGPTFPFSVEVAAHGWQGVRQCALMDMGGKACLVIEGDGGHLADWQTKAIALGIAAVTQVRSIPMDRRHGSKIDRTALRRRLGA